jgi:hypothetical protein
MRPTQSSLCLYVLLSCLSWKWRKRSSVKIIERTYEERAQARLPVLATHARLRQAVGPDLTLMNAANAFAERLDGLVATEDSSRVDTERLQNKVTLRGIHQNYCTDLRMGRS